MAAQSVCEMKAGLFRCRSEAAGVCVYCARSFCSQHGFLGEDGEEVCNRGACVAKREDLARHLAYKERALLLNRERICGAGGCRNEIVAQCARCRTYFCRRHGGVYEDFVLEDRVRVQRETFVCLHCWKRRAIWQKA